MCTICAFIFRIFIKVFEKKKKNVSCISLGLHISGQLVLIGLNKKNIYKKCFVAKNAFSYNL